MSTTSTEGMSLKRQSDSAGPDRKMKKLDTIFIFGEVKVSIIVDNDGNVWFKAVDLARALEMEDPHNSIYQKIDKKYCKSYKNLVSEIPRYLHIPNMQPKTTFVNERGMNLYLLRSRKPKAETFAMWVCGEVLPSIRITNKYEIEPTDNPYRGLNEYWKNKFMELEKENGQLKIKNIEHVDDIKKYTNFLFEMKPLCVQPLKNEVKNEYFVLYRKYDQTPPETDPMPYYACRVQLDSLEQRRNELLSKYPNLVKLLQLLVPNSVNFFNLVQEKMPNFIERGKGQSFKINGIDEDQFLLMIDNLHLCNHGGLRDNNSYIKDVKKKNLPE